MLDPIWLPNEKYESSILRFFGVLIVIDVGIIHIHDAAPDFAEGDSFLEGETSEGFWRKVPMFLIVWVCS